MLSTPAPFPQVGSYALWIDRDLPPSDQRAELARVILRNVWVDDPGGSTHMAMIALPNRTAATGNRSVPLDELIDGTALTKSEEREMHDIQRDLRGRDHLSPKQRKQQARATALRQRAMAAIILESELAKLHARQSNDLRRAGGSTGRTLTDMEHAGSVGRDGPAHRNYA